MKLLRIILCGLFGIVFVWSGYVKAKSPVLFLLDVRSFDLLGDPYAAWLALGLPWLEIIAGLAVITGLYRAGGLLMLNGLLVVFLIAILQAWVRGIDLKCGCFGSSDTSANYVELLLRDIVLLLVGGWLMWLESMHSRQHGLRSE
jgi:putative oxidoreductase